MNQVKNLRKEVKMKQHILASKLGIQRSNYANIENGRLIPKNLHHIKQRAIKILLPMLKSNVNTLIQDLEYYLKLVRKFDKNYPLQIRIDEDNISND